MEILTNNEILDVLIVAQVSRPNNFNSLTKPEWKFIVTEVKKDFGDLITQKELTEIVSNGVKGFYNQTQFVINCFTIYGWIRKFLQDKKSMPKQEIPCPKNMQSFYWNQMSERDKQNWIEKNPEKVEDNAKNENQSIQGTQPVLDGDGQKKGDNRLEERKGGK